MIRLLFVVLGLSAMTGLALAIPSPTPGPLLGAVAGPWGLVASALGYGAYRFYKAKF